LINQRKKELLRKITQPARNLDCLN